MGTSRCWRVARVSVTAKSTTWPFVPVTMWVICRSAAASWYPSTTRQIRSAMAWLTRAVPIASNGFMAVTSRNPSRPGPCRAWAQ